MAEMKWVTDSLGGYLNNPELSAKLRHAAQPLCKFRQFCDVKEAYGKRKDENWNFDKIGNIGAGGTLVETETIPTSTATIAQGTGTVTEYGNAIPFTGKLEALSKWNPKNPFVRVLRDDMAKVLDSAVEAQFDACKIRASYETDTTTVTFTTNGTATATASVLMDDYQVKEIVDYMEHTMFASPYDGSNFVGIGTVQAVRGLHDHLEQVWKYTKYPVNGEVGKYYNVRWVKDTYAMDGTIGNSNVAGEAYVFGNDTVAEAVVIPEEIRAKIPTDYGRSQGLAWYFLGGFKIIWAGDPSNTIVKVDSG